jgi:hypothetical protein
VAIDNARRGQYKGCLSVLCLYISDLVESLSKTPAASAVGIFQFSDSRWR